MKRCPYCGSIEYFEFKILSRIFHQCQECDLICRSIQEDYKKVLNTYSSGEYFDIHSFDQTDGKRDKLYNHILDSITQKKDSGSLLDVGTGSGFFLAAAQKRGWFVKGIEPSVDSARVAKRQNNLDVFIGTLQEYSGNERFDVITFINVLDHSAEPWKEIERANDLLKPNGILYLRFPNGLLHTNLYQIASQMGLASQIQKFLVFHQFPFTLKFIQRLLSDSGFSDIIILNSQPSEGDPHNLFFAPTFAQYVKKAIYLIAQIIRIFSYEKILVGTSLEVIAVKRPFLAKY